MSPVTATATTYGCVDTLRPQAEFLPKIVAGIQELGLRDRGEGHMVMLVGSVDGTRDLQFDDAEFLRYVRWLADWYGGLVVVELPGPEETAVGISTPLGIVHPTISDDGSPMVGFMPHSDHKAVTPEDAEVTAASLLAAARVPLDPGAVQRAIVAEVVADAVGLSPACTSAWQGMASAIADGLLARFDLVPREA